MTIAASTTKPLNASQLNSILADTISDLREGKIQTGLANSVFNGVSKVLGIARVQMDYAKMTKQAPDVTLLSLTVSPSIETTTATRKIKARKKNGS